MEPNFVEKFRVSDFFKNNTNNDLLPAFNQFLSEQINNNQIIGTQLQDLTCAICYESIDNFQDICRLKCSCKLWYHHGCLLQAYRDPKQRGKCLQCRNSISVILAWETILRKFGLSSQDWKNAYHKLYTDFYKNKEYGHGIRLTKLFFGDIKIFREKLPNYILLPLFDLNDYMVYSHKEHDEVLYREFDEILKGNSKNLETGAQIIGIQSLFETGDHTIISKKLFKRRFQEFSYNILDESFEWKNIFLAGGSIYRLISPIFSESTLLPDSSDLDLFIYGSKDEDRISALDRTLKYLAEKFGDDLFFIVHAERGLIDVYIRGYARHLQIICTMSETIIETLELFDLEHLQLGYFNGKVYATPYAIQAIKTQVSKRIITGALIKPDRLRKALGFHLSLILKLNGDKDSTDRSEKAYYEKDLYFLNDSVEKVKDVYGIKFLKPNNVKKFLDQNTVKCSIEKLKEAIEIEPYHPKYEEDDTSIILNLKKKVKKQTTLYFTKDIELVKKKIRFFKQTKDNFGYQYSGGNQENANIFSLDDIGSDSESGSYDDNSL